MRISESGVGIVYLASGEEGDRTGTVPTGQSSVTFAVATVDDSADQGGKAIIARLLTGTGYTLRPPFNRASVVVRDNDGMEPPPPWTW